MNKQDQIKQFLSQPIQVGDIVIFKRDSVEVHSLNDEGIFYKKYGELQFAPFSEVVKDTKHIGANPFPEKSINSGMQVLNYDLESVLLKLGFRKDREYTHNGRVMPYVNWNPFVLYNGKAFYYQRGFEWELLDNQLLIKSIYQNIDIGKIIIRNNEWHKVTNLMDAGYDAAFADIVDGKQRLNAILGFVNDEYPDLEGNYFSDLSALAQRKFMRFNGVAYSELREDTSDEDVLAIFLLNSYAGKPQSQEHLAYVENIYKKFGK